MTKSVNPAAAIMEMSYEEVSTAFNKSITTILLELIKSTTDNNVRELLKTLHRRMFLTIDAQGIDFFIKTSASRIYNHYNLITEANTSAKRDNAIANFNIQNEYNTIDVGSHTSEDEQLLTLVTTLQNCYPEFGDDVKTKIFKNLQELLKLSMLYIVNKGKK